MVASTPAKSFFKMLRDAQEGSDALVYEGEIPNDLSVEQAMRGLIHMDPNSFTAEALVAYLVAASHYVPKPDEAQEWADFWLNLCPPIALQI
jgi:hypothetical protein